MSHDTLLRVSDLSIRVGSLTICTNWNWQLERGQCWALLGRNGAGKTTLLNALTGLYPSRGHIELESHALAQLSRKKIAQRVGLLPQDFQDVFPGTVLETAVIGRHPHLPAWRWEGTTELDIARKALAEVELAELETREVSTLSGGERRRLGLATVLTQEPDIYLLDEPTNHLDLRHQHAMLASIGDRVRSTGAGGIMSLHDVNLATRYCDYAILLMENSEVICGETAAVLTAQNLSRMYDWPVRQLGTGTEKVFVSG